MTLPRRALHALGAHFWIGGYSWAVGGYRWLWKCPCGATLGREVR